MYHILLVEDDFALADALKTQIEEWGNQVTAVTDFHDVTGAFLAAKPQLVLLDIMLPFYNGYHWCWELRKITSVPIVFLSSASDNMNIVLAMNMGGDDFIAKPVDPMVLNAKLGALLRRTYELPDSPHVLTHGGAILRTEEGSLEFDGKRAELTKNELRILTALLENKGKTVSRDALMLALWQDDCYVEENTLTVNVARLRRKLDALGLPDFIGTKTGSGYIVK